MIQFFIVFAITSTSWCGFATTSQFQEAYVNQAHKDYSAARAGAEVVQKAVALFLQDTTPANLENAKRFWTDARKVYSRTEIYRFYGGPIDDVDGPEGLLNAWPLDEVYIDYVKGAADAGIINDLQTYPEITKELLVSLNEKDGEKNISTGWHAIEFLLWGQDFNNDGPGDRAVSDFILGEGLNADRRRAYLQITAELLVENLDSVLQEWDLQKADSYAQAFLAEPEREALNRAFTSLVAMSGDELAIERMFVALDGQLQEDEHSCFSDTTHFDLLHNFLGIKDQWALVRDNVQWYVGGEEIVFVIDQKLAQLENQFRTMMTPFDVAIFDPTGRKQIQDIVDTLQSLSLDFIRAKESIGIITL